MPDAVLFCLFWAAWLAVLWAAHWLLCRLTARRCPRCGSRWRTELVGEWETEAWACHACGYYWETPCCASKS